MKNRYLTTYPQISTTGYNDIFVDIYFRFQYKFFYKITQTFD